MSSSPSLHHHNHTSHLNAHNKNTSSPTKNKLSTNTVSSSDSDVENHEERAKRIKLSESVENVSLHCNNTAEVVQSQVSFF
jgi:hypothetical protein